MGRVIRSVDEATPEWLTARLREAGVLPQAAAVTAVESRGNDAFNSTVAHLTPAYSPGAPKSAPRRLVLKLNQEGWGENEIGFYELVRVTASAPEQPMVLPCYAAAYDPASGDSHLLLPDVSATHAPPLSRAQVLAGDTMPPVWLLPLVTDAIADFHAHWWEHATLGSGVGRVRPWYGTAEEHAAHVARREREWAQLVAAEGERLPTEAHALLDSALARLPALWERYLAPRMGTLRHLTLTNGDGYFAQFLCPRRPEQPDQRVYLIDFQDASGNFGAYDLIYLFATFWTPQQRTGGDLERSLLRRYWQRLVARGITGYPWEQLVEDYRVMLAYMVFDPVFNAVSGASRAYWEPKLRCLTAAYHDWRCNEL